MHFTARTATFSPAARPRRPGPAPHQVETLEQRALLSASIIDPTFSAREADVYSAVDYHDVAVLADGKVLAAGQRQVGDALNMTLTRFNADGTFDATFGSGGR